LLIIGFSQEESGSENIQGKDRVKHQMKLFFNNEKHEATQKISWETALSVRIRCSSNEIFSGLFVSFVV